VRDIMKCGVMGNQNHIYFKNSLNNLILTAIEYNNKGTSKVFPAHNQV